MTFSVYVVDDEQVAREGVALALSRTYRVRNFPEAESALAAMKDDPPDLVLLDIGLPGMDGLTALEHIKLDYPDMPVIMITAYEDVQTVVTAMKLGAHDYVVKPFQMDALLITLQNALDTIALRQEIQALHERYLKENAPCFLGESDAIQDVMEVVGKVARSPDTPILIVGETGTGKELIARAIHYRGRGFRKPLIAVNCAAIPNELIESELFGYEKGAFSGAALAGKKGLVEEAAGGTLFFDEVADLSLDAQAKILRFLENGEYYRVGGTRRRQVKTRVVSATNRALPQLIGEDRFRRDLYHRLAVVKIEVPSLNRRPDDIIPIARHFLVENVNKFKRHITGLSAGAESALKEHHWTGNVRELKNVVERAVLLADGPEIKVRDLGLQSRDEQAAATGAYNAFPPPLPPEGIDLPSTLKTIESQYIDQALRTARGNESRAARLLSMSRDTLRYRRKSRK